MGFVLFETTFKMMLREFRRPFCRVMGSDDIRRTVADHWIRRFEKSTPKADEETELEVSAVNVEDEGTQTEEPNPKRQKPSIPKEVEVIDLSDSDNDFEKPIEVVSDADVPISEVENVVESVEAIIDVIQKPKGYESPIVPIHNPTYDNPKLRNSLTVSDLLSSPKLKSSYLFSFQYNLDFILPQFASRDVDLIIVHQEGTVADSSLRASFTNLRLVKVFMQPFTSHHPKLIINFYDDETCKIFLVSCNLTQLEFETNNQMVWQSPFLKQAPSSKDTPFKQHLFDYLRNYDKPPLNTLCLKLKKFDFGPILGDFVSSATSTSNKFGYLGLYNSLLLNGLIPKKFEKDRQLLYQTSSIASAIRHSEATKESTNIFTHLLAPLFSGKYTSHGKLNISKDFPMNNGYQSVIEFGDVYKVKPYIIFPSLSDVRNSLFGYRSGGWSHYNPFSKWNIPMNKFLTKYVFHHSYTKQRRTNSSHTKFLIMSSDNFKTLDWVVFTSANMSKQAWGNVPKRGTLSASPTSSVSNYETGVLLSPKDYGSGKKFIPLEIGEEKELKDDEIPIILPFKLPPKQYESDEEPWCLKKGCDLPDIRGVIHIGE